MTDQKTKIIELVRRGVLPFTAAQSLGVSADAYRLWMRSDAGFCVKVLAAQEAAQRDAEMRADLERAFWTCED